MAVCKPTPINAVAVQPATPLSMALVLKQFQDACNTATIASAPAVKHLTN